MFLLSIISLYVYRYSHREFVLGITCKIRNITYSVSYQIAGINNVLLYFIYISTYFVECVSLPMAYNN